MGHRPERPQDPAVAAARSQAAEAQRAAAAARVAASANWRQAVDAARLAVRLASEAVADLIGWAAHGIRSGSSMLVAWLVSLAVAGRHRLRHGSATAGRHVRTGSAATRDGLRAGSAATRDSLRATSAATREGRPARRRPAAGSAAPAPASPARPAGSPPGSTPWPTAARRPAGAGRSEPPRDGPAVDPAATQEFDVAGNGHADGAGLGRLVMDPGDPVEAWWLSSMADQVEPVEEAPAPVAGRRARAGGGGRRRPLPASTPAWAPAVWASRPPVRAAGARLAPVVTALAAPQPAAAGLYRSPAWWWSPSPLRLLVATRAAVPAGILVADSVKEAGAGLPELEELRQLRQPERTQVYDRQGRVIEVLKDEQDRIVVPLSKISPTLQQAVVAAEDARFYEHKGVDDRGIVRAAVSNLLSGEVSQGGSTITQQLVRNSYADLKDISIVRKVKAALAAQLETKLSKDEILHRYLNPVYFGAGYYGVEAASRATSAAAPPRSPWPRRPCSPGSSRNSISSDPRHHPEPGQAAARLGAGADDPARDDRAQAAKAKKQPLKIRPRSVGGHVVHRRPQAPAPGGRAPRPDPGGPDPAAVRGQPADPHHPGPGHAARGRGSGRPVAAPSGPDIALVAIDPRDGGVGRW